VDTSLQPFVPEFEPAILGVFLPDPSTEPDHRRDLWPFAGTPEPDLYKRGLTEARCVVQFYHGETTEERLDGFSHLVNIAMLKRGRSFWSQRPALKYVNTGKLGYKTAHLDWENYSDGADERSTRGWFQTKLPELIDRYAPEFITRRELLELARIQDADLLHVCDALVRDLINEGRRQERRELQTAPPVDSSFSATCVSKPEPNYDDVVQMIVQDKRMRSALPKKTLVVVEAVFRKLAAGVNPENVITDVARDLNRSERTVLRHLERASEIRVQNSGVGDAIKKLARAAFQEQASSCVVEHMAHKESYGEWLLNAYCNTERVQ
jgi:hypothetical protein